MSDIGCRPRKKKDAFGNIHLPSRELHRPSPGEAALFYSHSDGHEQFAANKRHPRLIPDKIT
ncbi:MAG: hypothetical protein EBS01_07705 [Verrucomicrobia bacterium]|nr:hypothetical protein [Verrucomicrobiota bacterium]